MQVSTEYSSFKRDAEVKMDELQQERDEAREELQLAMVAGSVSSAGQWGARRQQSVSHAATQKEAAVQSQAFTNAGAGIMWRCTCGSC